jgi:phospholipid transport system substrate-binding protein
MRSTGRLVVLASALVLGVTISRPAGAGEPTDQLRARIDRAVGILDDGGLKAKPAARREALRGVAAEIFDFAEITRRSLGPHWQTVPPAEREELVRLLGGLLERTYMTRVEQYGGERIVFVGEAVAGDYATVRTRFMTKGGTEIPVDYRLAHVGDRWLAYDVSIEGVSLVASYRAQFNKIMQTSSAQGLVERLRARQE